MESINPVYARLVLRELERRQIDTSSLFAATSLTRAELLNGGDISMEDFIQILQVGHELSGDEQLGLMIGRGTSVIGLGAVGASMAVAPTLRAGLQVLESYTRLISSYIGVMPRSTLEGITLSVRYLQELGYVKRFHTEAAVTMIQQYVETLTGLPLDDARYRFDFAEPTYSTVYEQCLHSPVEFDAPVTEVDIPRHWLDQPSPHFNAGLWRQGQITLADHIKAAPGKHSLEQHILALLRASEPPLPDLAFVARGLHVSERTLNRRLRQEGTTFRQLKSLALANWAKLYLGQTELSVEAIAATLGYQDAANFRRAFKKTEGIPPQAFRSLSH